MIKKLGFGLVLFLLLPSPVLALVCSSPKKGAALLNESASAKSSFGVSHFYRYSPISSSNNTTPMLKYPHIYFLKQNQNPGVCNVPCALINPISQVPETFSSENMCCPAKKIQETITARKNLPAENKYWLILNEPEWKEDKYYKKGVGKMTEDILFAIDYLLGKDPQAKFIVAWYPGVSGQWRTKVEAGDYKRVNSDYTKVIAGWHIHTYRWQSTLYNTNTINTYLANFKQEISEHGAVKDKEKGLEVWLTEFGTLMEGGGCEYLATQTGCECRFDRIDNDPNQLCVDFMKKLLYWLESDSSIDRYFWWSYGNCDSAWLTGSIAGNRDACFGALTTRTSGSAVINNLGKAFAALPNTNEACWYGESSCPNGSLGNLNCDSQGLIDELDLAFLLANWDSSGGGSFLNTLLNNWKTD
ncbi:hypothetical protein ISS42_02985 [Candidatus Shapirobacteria bacterium]|nr:hypothetical protein [Candidatus Shapirobacteria bacterium]